MTTYRFGAGLFGELDRLQRQMSGLFAAPTFTAAARAGRFDAFPPINVGITDDAIEIVALAPGMQAADFDVTIDKGLLTITGERKAAEDAAESRVLARERFAGRFRRAVELPSTADAGQIQARYDNGCLRIRIAKRAASQPRSIHVQ
ncbi:Hsp20/alpha crystallin family protein [Burkholderia plantarii]|uniref:Heat shock protein Hsp20 n=1 Tax=Burkholderia plantarii TaxID=41899 RepID=A0A0B6RU77_BURPL|nr:Hsp20/alpha crystallin family protein [Burkholderia plantarii]AJK45724.1 heat shock protein Hsp20 [Burkholderia plantarii]ALK29973.1 Heat shock protein Hsp20 [Burkholderia plantarii]WLE58721.1 Hsp20/alpha crystallin family protein [Burkholderia plantarii]GLZ21756.1 heat-shock protein Hsp20 [Burkholderia plantarii]